MTIAQDLYLDQQRVEEEQDIALDLYMSGITDGYMGNRRESADSLYLQGYIEGLSQYNRELEEEIERILAICPEAKKESGEDCPF